MTRLRKDPCWHKAKTSFKFLLYCVYILDVPEQCEFADVYNFRRDAGRETLSKPSRAGKMKLGPCYR